MLEDRDYKFTDEQVRTLGFTSYEELEKYYDVLYSNMSNQPWTKQQCSKELEALGIEFRLDLSRRDRLKSSLDDRFEILKSWDDKTWIPTPEEVRKEKENLLKILDVYCNFSERQCVVDLENSEKISHHL